MNIQSYVDYSHVSLNHSLLFPITIAQYERKKKGKRKRKKFKRTEKFEKKPRNQVFTSLLAINRETNTKCHELASHPVKREREREGGGQNLEFSRIVRKAWDTVRVEWKRRRESATINQLAGNKRRLAQ